MNERSFIVKPALARGVNFVISPWTRVISCLTDELLLSYSLGAHRYGSGPLPSRATASPAGRWFQELLGRPC